jgi:hypothetical protein
MRLTRLEHGVAGGGGASSSEHGLAGNGGDWPALAVAGAVQPKVEASNSGMKYAWRFPAGLHHPSPDLLSGSASSFAIMS